MGGEVAPSAGFLGHLYVLNLVRSKIGIFSISFNMFMVLPSLDNMNSRALTTAFP